MTSERREAPGQTPDNATAAARARDFFSVPAPVKRIFDKFPLVTYPANDLPYCSWSNRQGNRLFVFTDAAGARHGRPSFNPQCLKWQVIAYNNLPLKSRIVAHDARLWCSRHICGSPALNSTSSHPATMHRPPAPFLSSSPPCPSATTPRSLPASSKNGPLSKCTVRRSNN